MRLLLLILIILTSHAHTFENNNNYHCETELVLQPFMDKKSIKNPKGSNKMKVYVRRNEFMKFEFDNQFTNLKVKYKTGNKFTERMFLCEPTIIPSMLTCNGVVGEYKSSQLVNWSKKDDKFVYFSTSPAGYIANSVDAEITYYGKCKSLR